MEKYLPPPELVVWEMSFSPGPAASAAMRTPAARREGIFVGPGRKYTILRTSEGDEYDEPATPAELLSFARTVAAPLDDKFRGTSRRSAKLSLIDGPPEVFGDLKELVDTLEDHDSMVARNIPTTATSNRVPVERRQVRVDAFLYAASREDDNDFHLIIGRDPQADPLFFTAELSGLPPANQRSFDRLKAARDAFRAFFPTLPGTRYDFYTPPIPIVVEGSLFWDASHAHGSRPGPQTLRPNMPVVWEIHPISEIIFEP
jgi:hypothetical protein